MRCAAMILVAALAAAPALAEEHAAARAAFVRGTEAWDGGRYAKALHAFMDAYELSRAPELLFDIGQCRFALHDYDGAAVAYERYLREAPPGADHALARGRLSDARAASRARAGGGDDDTASALIDEWWFWGGVSVAAALVTTTVLVGTVLAQSMPVPTTY